MEYVHRSVVPHACDEVFAWHARPGAFQRLTPPWQNVTLERSDGSIQDGAKVVLTLRRGPASLRWTLRYRDYEEGRRFRDVQVSGPFRSWAHTHLFEPTDAGCAVEDRVEVELPAGSRLGRGCARSELERVFRFRHERLRNDLARHAAHAGPRLTVAITGASGLVGRNLTHFLTAGGHTVVPLVRDRRRAVDGAVYWNPTTGHLDPRELAEVDAVVHLAGETISGLRWTAGKKREIMESRRRGTELIAWAAAANRDRIKVLVSSSAVGFYGNRGQEKLDEAAGPGSGFLAEVTRAWEDATVEARRAGVRVVRLRTGMALSPEGGALGQMLLPFKMGAGGRLGSGRQYLSWIDMDDLVGLIHHALTTPQVSGALNATAPHPVTNATFTTALGRVLGRPTIVPVPRLAVKAVFGEMGDELLLRGQRVLPAKALSSGFSFFYEGVEESLRFQLGRAEPT